jgi:hypothetical protein
MTLTDLLNALYSDLGYSDGTPSAAVTTRLTRYCNEGYRYLLSMPELAPLRMGTVTFTSVPGLKVYGVPQILVQIDQLVNQTNPTRLRLMTADEFRTIDPQEDSSGTPTHYVRYGVGPALRTPAGTGLWADTEVPGALTPTLNITVRGAGREEYFPFPPQSALITGLGRVKIGGFNDYRMIQDIQLDQPPQLGTLINVYDAATGGNLIAQIPQGETTSRYELIRLWPTPSGTDTYVADGPVLLADLSATTPIPQIPFDFQYILTDYARMREYEYRDDSRVAMAAAGYQQKLKYLRDRVINPPDYRPRVGRLRDRSNNLDHDGVNFPTGRW